MADQPSPGKEPSHCTEKKDLRGWALCRVSVLGFTPPAVQPCVWKCAPYRNKTAPPLSAISSVQLLSRVRLFATPWTAACQASLSITNSWCLLKFMSIEPVMSSNHLILSRPLLLPPSIFPSITVFSNESVLEIKWPKY